MEGKIALQYGLLIRQMWSASRFSSIAPHGLKKTIGKTSSDFHHHPQSASTGQFAPEFVGFRQQDAQEFLSFLLDGLYAVHPLPKFISNCDNPSHEDLNRIVEKPFVEFDDSNNRPDEIVAKEFWDGSNYIIDIIDDILLSPVFRLSAAESIRHC
jgi:hypothetical protein